MLLQCCKPLLLNVERLHDNTIKMIWWPFLVPKENDADDNKIYTLLMGLCVSAR